MRQESPQEKTKQNKKTTRFYNTSTKQQSEDILCLGKKITERLRENEAFLIKISCDQHFTRTLATYPNNKMRLTGHCRPQGPHSGRGVTASPWAVLLARRQGLRVPLTYSLVSMSLSGYSFQICASQPRGNQAALEFATVTKTRKSEAGENWRGVSGCNTPSSVGKHRLILAITHTAPNRLSSKPDPPDLRPGLSELAPLETVPASNGPG